MAIEIARHKFKVDQYYRMTEVGVLPEDATIELVEGDIVVAAPISPRHAYVTTQLMYFFLENLPRGRAHFRTRNPVHIDPYNEPNPDVTIAQYREDEYRNGHPDSSEVELLIEVADASIEFDRRVKLPIYAAAGIKEVWIVDLVLNRFEVYREPQGRSFAARIVCPQEESLSLLAFPDLVVPVSKVIP